MSGLRSAWAVLEELVSKTKEKDNNNNKKHFKELFYLPLKYRMWMKILSIHHYYFMDNPPLPIAIFPFDPWVFETSSDHVM